MKKQFLCAWSRDQRVNIWHLPGLTDIKQDFKVLLLKTIDHFHSVDVRSIDFNSSIMVIADENSDIFVWNMKAFVSEDQVKLDTSSCLMSTLTGHIKAVHSLQLTATCMLSCDEGGVLFLRDYFDVITQNAPARRLLKCEDGVNTMICDTARIYCGLLNKSIVIFDRHTMEKVQVLFGHTDHIWSLDINENSTLLASGCWGSSVKLWMREKEEKLFKLKETFSEPGLGEICSVKILKSRLYISTHSGKILVVDIKETLIPIQSLSYEEDSTLGPIYSMLLDKEKNELITSHLNGGCSVLQVLKVNPITGELIPLSENLPVASDNPDDSIVWNMCKVEWKSRNLLILCRNNEFLDIYDLNKFQNVMRIRHPVKVMTAQFKKG